MRISPLAVLGALVFYFQAVLSQSMDISIPPEDLDLSGDDDESFSGSGVGPLIEHPMVALNVPLQGSTNTSLKPEVSTDRRDTQPKVEVTNSPVEDYSRVLLSTASIPVFQTNDLESNKPAVMIEDEYLDSVTEPETTRPTIITTEVPIMHNATSRTASTVKIIEHNYHDTYSVSSIDKTSAFDIVPAKERNFNPTRPSAVFSTVQTDSSPLFEKEPLPSEDGSGVQEDFTFSQIEENPINVKESGAGKVSIDTEAKDSKSEGAPQGIMDRKEVLGGVIAGGLVGLLFAGFLVGFMLYRMKKKDEGSYSLDEPKQSNGGYQKPHKQEEFYA